MLFSFKKGNSDSFGDCMRKFSNSGLLRIEFLLPGEKLSEPGPNSDSFRGRRRKTVRTWSYFGQLSWSQAKSCPNSGLLRPASMHLKTTMILPDEKLSESNNRPTQLAPYLFEITTANAVKSCIYNRPKNSLLLNISF